MYGDAIRISYLLDPVMIGDSMSDAHRNHAETALFDSVSCGIVITEENQDGIDNKKEQLFKEYTEWIINAREFINKTQNPTQSPSESGFFPSLIFGSSNNCSWKIRYLNY